MKLQMISSPISWVQKVRNRSRQRLYSGCRYKSIWWNKTVRKRSSRRIFFCITGYGKLIEAYKSVNPNAKIELQTSDSTTGMTSTLEGSYDIGMASRELKEEEVGQGLQATVIATDGIAVIVNNDNPTEELSSDQVKSIYTGETYTWDEVTE